MPHGMARFLRRAGNPWQVVSGGHHPSGGGPFNPCTAIYVARVLAGTTKNTEFIKKDAL
jgi:hypothetical protein